MAGKVVLDQHHLPKRWPKEQAEVWLRRRAVKDAVHGSSAPIAGARGRERIATMARCCAYISATV